jgi:hypothetical protein
MSSARSWNWLVLDRDPVRQYPVDGGRIIIRLQRRRNQIEANTGGSRCDQTIRTSNDSGHFHHIDIDSIGSIPLAGREVPSAPPNHSGRVEGKMRMFDWRKSSGVDAPRKKISFFSPRGEGRVRAKARGVHLGRPFKLNRHQQREAIARREAGEALTDIARTFGVHHTTIGRLRA